METLEPAQTTTLSGACDEFQTDLKQAPKDKYLQGKDGQICLREGPEIDPVLERAGPFCAMNLNAFMEDELGQLTQP